MYIVFTENVVCVVRIVTIYDADQHNCHQLRKVKTSKKRTSSRLQGPDKYQH